MSYTKIQRYNDFPSSHTVVMNLINLCKFVRLKCLAYYISAAMQHYMYCIISIMYNNCMCVRSTVFAGFLKHLSGKYLCLLSGLISNLFDYQGGFANIYSSQ